MRTSSDLLFSMFATLAALALVVWLIVKYATADDADRLPGWRYLVSGLLGIVGIATGCLGVRAAWIYLVHGHAGDACLSLGTGALMFVVFGSMGWLLVSPDKPLSPSELPPDSRIGDEPRGPWGDDGSAKP